MTLQGPAAKGNSVIQPCRPPATPHPHNRHPEPHPASPRIPREQERQEGRADYEATDRGVNLLPPRTLATTPSVRAHILL